MTEKTPIDKAWQSYRAQFPKGASPQSVASHKNAFFAGAAGLYQYFMTPEVLSEGDDVQDEDYDAMRCVMDELNNYAAKAQQEAKEAAAAQHLLATKAGGSA